MDKVAAWLVTAIVFAAPAAIAAQGGDDAQVEKGRAVVAQVCTTCHTTLGRMLQVHKQTPQQWKDLVYFMISRGAQLMPDEIEPVAAFLTATAGRARPAAQGPAPQAPDTRK
jgi:hypothetical protein